MKKKKKVYKSTAGPQRRGHVKEKEGGGREYWYRRERDVRVNLTTPRRVRIHNVLNTENPLGFLFIYFFFNLKNDFGTVHVEYNQIHYGLEYGTLVAFLGDTMRV